MALTFTRFSTPASTPAQQWTDLLNEPMKPPAPIPPGWNRNTLERDEDRTQAEMMAALMGLVVYPYDGGLWIERNDGGVFSLDHKDIGPKVYAVSWPMAIDLMKAMQFQSE